MLKSTLRGVGNTRATKVVLGVLAFQVLLSSRFFAKYLPATLALPAFLAYALLVLGGGVLVTRLPGVFRIATGRAVFLLALLGLLAGLLVAYPRADALRAVGRGSDQDDCVRLLVDNVFAGAKPYSPSYFGNPCSTGPTEFALYFPVHISYYFIPVMQVLSLLLACWVLSHLVDVRTARLLTLSQLTSLLFVELAVVGTDFIIPVWQAAPGPVVPLGEPLSRFQLRRSRPSRQHQPEPGCSPIPSD